ncbi:galactose-1-phosphate uridylyltransferase [Obelidium mucronatum]|nr:galactose-1-phosphate uridylyltransferase [Obelidium mucronatum]
MDDDSVHRRYNPLTNSWVLCSPHRAKRPWLGQNEKPVEAHTLEFDAACSLCPRNTRPGAAAANPDYKATFSFNNDFPALTPAGPSSTASPSDLVEAALFSSAPAAGVCKVTCFTPAHNVTLAELPVPAIEAVLNEWIRVENDIQMENPEIQYAQFFENKGSVMGCSQPHAHSQCWATTYIPNEPSNEFASLLAFSQKHDGKCLLCCYAELEMKKGDRIVYQNDHFLVVVPYWATWPFETLILSKAHLASLKSLTPSQKYSLAQAMKSLTVRYDNLFETSFPYSMGVHGAPLSKASNNGDDVLQRAAHLHLHYYPPLLRSATVKKFLVGYEMLGEAQRDLTAEMAASRLRVLSGDEHYKSKQN